MQKEGARKKQVSQGQLEGIINGDSQHRQVTDDYSLHEHYTFYKDFVERTMRNPNIKNVEVSEY